VPRANADDRSRLPEMLRVRKAEMHELRCIQQWILHQ
jgi:hypothetical protein